MGRENDPCTGKLLHACPVNKYSTLDELDSLYESDKLYKDDWRWMDLVINACGDEEETLAAVEEVINKHHRPKRDLK